MKYSELKRNIAKSGLSIAAFAKLLKMNPKSITNLSTNQEGAIPKNLFIIAHLLAQLKELGVDPENALSNLDIHSQKPRKDIFYK